LVSGCFIGVYHLTKDTNAVAIGLSTIANDTVDSRGIENSVSEVVVTQTVDRATDRATDGH
jgi:hypothetical protein